MFLDTEEKEQHDRFTADSHAFNLDDVTIWPKVLRFLPDRTGDEIVDYRKEITKLPVSPCRSAAVVTNLVCNSTDGGKD